LGFVAAAVGATGVWVEGGEGGSTPFAEPHGELLLLFGRWFAVAELHGLGSQRKKG